MSNLQYMRYSLQQLQQFGVAIIWDSALLSKVMVVRRDEFSDGHQAAGLVFHQVNDISTKLDQLWIAYRALAALQPRVCANPRWENGNYYKLHFWYKKGHMQWAFLVTKFLGMPSEKNNVFTKPINNQYAEFHFIFQFDLVARDGS